jgi:hypothetical protein
MIDVDRTDYFAVVNEEGCVTMVPNPERPHAALWLHRHEADTHRAKMERLNRGSEYRIVKVRVEWSDDL